MKIAVLGDKGSIGSRHLKNLMALGIETISYDTASGPPELRAAVIGASDAVVIATPTNRHLDDLRDVIRAGKHAFVEKPIAHDTAVKEILDAARLTNRVVFVGNNLRYHACVRAAKEQLLIGAIGRLLWASITVGQFTLKEPYLRDGVTLNYGAHEIDLALHLLGPATVLSANTRNTKNGQDDISDFVLLHDGGCRSVVHLDYVTNPEIRATTIVGERGQITIDLVKRWSCQLTVGEPLQQFNATDSFDQNYIDEMKGFLSRCNGHKEIIGTTGEDGLATLKIIEEVKRRGALTHTMTIMPLPQSYKEKP